MTTERDDEARLRALFDRTADDASGPTLTRLSARAREVPSQGRRSWLSQLWAPALAVAAGAFAVVLATGQFASLKPTPVASTPASASPSEAPVARPAPERSEAAVAGVDDFGFGESANDGILSPLDGPTSDDDVDAWLAATESVLGESG